MGKKKFYFSKLDESMAENIEKYHSKLNEYFYMKLRIIIMVGCKVLKNKIIFI